MRIVRIVLVLACLVSPVGPVLDAAMVRVEVTLKFTGITHLVGKKTTERLILIPNHKSDDHELIIASPVLYEPDLPYDGEDGTTTYKWGPLDPGFTIDVVNSTGWADAFADNENKTLVFTELGDPAETCPDMNIAPVESLHWLPRLSTVSKHWQATVKKEFEMADPDKAKVWARLPLENDKAGGVLQAELPGERFKFIFREGWFKVDDIRQTMAAYLNYTFVVKLEEADPKFKLMGADFQTGNPRTLGTFKAVNKKIEIVFANMMPGEFFEPQDRDSHFHLYFKPVDGAPAVRVRNLGEKCAKGTGSEIECGPVRLP
jgi:hypothetical protein